jgi:hypothetical protein
MLELNLVNDKDQFSSIEFSKDKRDERLRLCPEILKIIKDILLNSDLNDPESKNVLLSTVDNAFNAWKDIDKNERWNCKFIRHMFNIKTDVELTYEKIQLFKSLLSHRNLIDDNLSLIEFLDDKPDAGLFAQTLKKIKYTLATKKLSSEDGKKLVSIADHLFKAWKDKDERWNYKFICCIFNIKAEVELTYERIQLLNSLPSLRDLINNSKESSVIKIIEEIINNDLKNYQVSEINNFLGIRSRGRGATN